MSLVACKKKTIGFPRQTISDMQHHDVITLAQCFSASFAERH
jgi:hypothetical protein